MKTDLVNEYGLEKRVNGIVDSYDKYKKKIYTLMRRVRVTVLTGEAVYSQYEEAFKSISIAWDKSELMLEQLVCNGNCDGTVYL